MFFSIFSILKLYKSFEKNFVLKNQINPILMTFPNQSFRQRNDSLDLLKESFLWAVPKKRVSKSRKRMRNGLKYGRNLRNIESCIDCGSPKLLHHLCKSCFEKNVQTTQEYKKSLPSLHERFPELKAALERRIDRQNMVKSMWDKIKPFLNKDPQI